MVIKSYIAYPAQGRLAQLTGELSQIAGCEVTPATNQELVVLVTEAVDEAADEALAARLNSLPSLQALTLVSGHNENPSGKRPPRRAG